MVWRHKSHESNECCSGNCQSDEEEEEGGEAECEGGGAGGGVSAWTIAVGCVGVSHVPVAGCFRLCFRSVVMARVGGEEIFRS